MSRKDSFTVDTAEDEDSNVPAVPLHQISFDELMKAAPSSSADLSTLVTGVDPSAELVDPEELVAKAFAIVGIHINEGDYGGDFVSVECRTADGLVVFNDGGTGVFTQLGAGDPEEIGKIPLPMAVPHGLRVSRYDLAECPSCGQKQPRRSAKRPYACRRCGQDLPADVVSGKAATFYLDTKR